MLTHDSLMTAPDLLRDAVAKRYGQVATEPAAAYPFSVGRAPAEAAGYPPVVLDGLPPRAVASFSGVAYLPGWVDLFPGQQVVDLSCGAVESLPVADAMADVVSANGVFSLAPGKEPALAEAFRVLKPGGRLTAAEIVLRHDVPLAERGTLDGWFR